MDLTLLLSQVLGIYFIIGGIAIWRQRSCFIPVVGSFVEERLLRFIVGSIEMIAGLFVVLTHNVWSTLPEMIVSFVGWMMVIEGALYLIASDATLKKLIDTLNRPWWYTFGALLVFVVGVYLTSFGFGLL